MNVHFSFSLTFVATYYAFKNARWSKIYSDQYTPRDKTTFDEKK